jgi:hypothetical protein
MSALLRGFTSQEEGLRLPLREVTVVIGLAQQLGAHHQPGLAQPLRHPLRPPPTEVEHNRVTQRFRSVQRVVTDLEPQEHQATWDQHPAELSEGLRHPLIRDMDNRIPGQQTAKRSAGRSSASIEPTSNRRPGYVRRATSIIPGDRSIPNTGNPRPSRYAVTRPVPHPTSATGPAPAARTTSANPASIARSSGLASSSSPIRSA